MPENSNNITPVTGNLDFVRRKCKLCTNLVPQKEMKLVQIEEEKFILAAMVPHRFVPINHTSEFVQIKKPRVCFEHIIEASTKIEEYIRDPKAIQRILMPKIRSINTNLTTNRKDCILTQFLFRNKKRNVKPTKDVLNFRCVLCRRLREREKMSRFSALNPKTAIMVGCVLRGKYTIEEAKQYITPKKEQPVCRKHFKKSIGAIFDFLEIENLLELSKSSPDLMDKLMETAKSLLPGMTIAQFENSVKELARKLEPSQKPVNESTNYSNRSCRVCTKLRSMDKMTIITSITVKTTILAVGVLRGTQTIEEAKRIIMLGKHDAICRKHFKKVIEHIFEILAIKNLREIDDCSEELMDKLMETVNAILPTMRIPQFKESVHELAKRVEKFRQQEDSNSKFTEDVTELVDDFESSQEENETATNSQGTQYGCGVCQLLHPRDKFLEVKSKTSKMLIMLGCVLRETHTLKEAESFISSRKEELSCRKHFRKTIQKILNALEIPKTSEISYCSKSSMNILMTTVNSLRPNLTVQEFKTSVAKLASKVEKFEAQRKLNNDQKKC